MSTPPQTGAGGQVNTQNLLQQVLGQGVKSGSGMVPPGSTGITRLTTLGTNGTAIYLPGSGAMNIPNYSAVPAGSTGIVTLSTASGSTAAYNPNSGTLTIPVYASGLVNFQKSFLTGTGFSVSSTAQLAMGNSTGFLFTPRSNPCVLISFMQLCSLSVSNIIPAIVIVRSTNLTIPAAGTPVPAPDDPILETRMVNQTPSFSLSGSAIDTNITVGVTYCYYLAMWLSYGAGTASATAGVLNSSFSAFEVK